MGVIEGVAWIALLCAVVVASYRAGWAERGRQQREDDEEEARGWFELSLILLHRSEEELAKADRQHRSDAVGRLRRMPPDAVQALRAGHGALFEELSDRLLLQERKTERIRRRIEADPSADPAVKALFVGAEAPLRSSS